MCWGWELGVFSRADNIENWFIQYSEWFSMAWLVRFMILKYRCRLEHLLHILLFTVLMWTFYFVNNYGNDCGAWKKLPLKFKRQSTFQHVCCVQPVVVLTNKCDFSPHSLHLFIRVEAFSLGFCNPHPHLHSGYPGI